MSDRFLFFDIETAPAKDWRDYVKPFDKDSVKLGNIKDPAKIFEKQQKSEKEHWANAEDKAALNGLTGEVVAIGYMFTESNEVSVLDADDLGEEVVIRAFFRLIADNVHGSPKGVSQARLCGWNIKGFDLPFLSRRGWKHGIDFSTVHFNEKYGIGAHSNVDDLQLRFAGGKWEDRFTSLDMASKFLGFGGKTEGITGKDWHKSWRGDEDQRALAQEYIETDVKLLAEIAERIGVVTLTQLRGAL